MSEPLNTNPADLSEPALELIQVLSQIVRSVSEGADAEDAILAQLTFAVGMVTAALFATPDYLERALQATKTPVRIEFTGEPDRW